METPLFPADLTPCPATTADYPQVAALLTQEHPDWPRAAADLERFDAQRLPGEVHERRLWARAEELVATAEVSTPRMENHSGWLNVEFTTLERDLAAPLLAWAEAVAAQHGAEVLVTRVREDWWERAIFETAGYTEHDRMWTSTLDLTTLGFARFATQEARARASGVTLRPLSDLGEFDEAQQRKLYDLVAALLRDVPSALPIPVWPFEVWQEKFLPRLQHPEGLWLAVAPNGDWVGLSELHQPVPTHPGMLHNGLTGVLPEWRGQSIALALKLAAARAALERGMTHARTSNHSINAPMLAVNEKLGFVRGAATITLKKVMSAG